MSPDPTPLPGLQWETLSPTAPTPREPPEAVLRAALTDSPSLRRLLDSASLAGEPVLMVVNDPHRSTLTRAALVALATWQPGQRDASGVRAAGLPRFRALVATGTHRFDAAARDRFERETFGECALDMTGVTWHDAQADALLVPIGGVRFHRLVSEHRFLLAIGSVEPHYFAGVTGPHKTLTVGCMAQTDIEDNHAGALSPASGILGLEGNPVFDGIVAAVDELRSAGKMICTIGEVVRGQDLLDAAVGDPLDVVHRLLPTVRQVYVQHISEPADVLRLRVPPPLGDRLYQADKALKNNHLAVRDGGGIILEADCREGVGPYAFLDLLRTASDYNMALDIIRQRGYRLGDHKAVKLHHLMDPARRNVRVALVTPWLSPDVLHGTGIETFPDLPSALAWIGNAVTGTVARGLIIEDAGMLCVTTAPA